MFDILIDDSIATCGWRLSNFLVFTGIFYVKAMSADGLVTQVPIASVAMSYWASYHRMLWPQKQMGYIDFW